MVNGHFAISDPHQSSRPAPVTQQADPWLPESLRDDFPLLARRHPAGAPVVYLDSAATALKPRAVIDAVAAAMSRHTANVHRAVHFLGDEATELYEGARRKVARLIGAQE